jgi:farnesyl-diphosphate farnesyltransferase
MAPETGEIRDLLKQVSRSFYLTLRVLPRPINLPLSVAYLLARATDTVADTSLVEVSKRREALTLLRTAIRQACEGSPPLVPDFGKLAEDQGSPAERALLANIARPLTVLRDFSPVDRICIHDALHTITQGQEKDLVRFGAASADSIVALETDLDLDEYTYCVAGSVGEFWTRMCREHLFPAAFYDDSALLSCGVRFGKGLQLVNILRDLPNDLRQGRCYIPLSRLREHGLEPRDLLDGRTMGRFRSLYDGYLNQAEGHLRSGWQYTTMLPRSQVRVRLACAWPVLIGLKTLERLREGNVLDDAKRIKLSRSDVRGLMLRSLFLICRVDAASRR